MVLIQLLESLAAVNGVSTPVDSSDQMNYLRASPENSSPLLFSLLRAFPNPEKQSRCERKLFPVVPQSCPRMSWKNPLALGILSREESCRSRFLEG